MDIFKVNSFYIINGLLLITFLESIQHEGIEEIRRNLIPIHKVLLLIGHSIGTKAGNIYTKVEGHKKIGLLIKNGINRNNGGCSRFLSKSE